MKARIKLVAKFSWEFAEIEYDNSIQEKINKFAELVRERILSILGFEPKAEIHWDIEVSQPKVYDLPDFIQEDGKDF